MTVDSRKGCSARALSVRSLERGSTQRAGRFLLSPLGRFRQKRSNYQQWQRRDQAAHERVSPRRIRVLNLPQRALQKLGHLHCGQIQCVGHSHPVRNSHHQTADGAEGLGDPKNLLALVGVIKELRQPGDGGNKLHTYADKHAATADQQHVQ